LAFFFFFVGGAIVVYCDVDSLDDYIDDCLRLLWREVAGRVPVYKLNK
jgi:hypothetical protein